MPCRECRPWRPARWHRQLSGFFVTIIGSCRRGLGSCDLLRAFADGDRAVRPLLPPRSNTWERFDLRRIPEASGIVRSRDTRAYSGSTTTRATPLHSSPSAATAGSSGSSAWQFRTSTGRTSPSTTRGTFTLETSATTACCAAGPGRLPDRRARPRQAGQPALAALGLDVLRDFPARTGSTPKA